MLLNGRRFTFFLLYWLCIAVFIQLTTHQVGADKNDIIPVPDPQELPPVEVIEIDGQPITVEPALRIDLVVPPPAQPVITATLNLTPTEHLL